MEIKIETIVPREVLENICVTSLEGGSNYWYYLSSDALKLIRNAVPKSVDNYLSTAILKAVLDHNVEVPINDVEDEGEILGYLSSKTLQDRIQALAKSDNSWALHNELREEGDASSSDIVFQYMVLGEVVYG